MWLWRCNRVRVSCVMGLRCTTALYLNFYGKQKWRILCLKNSRKTEIKSHEEMSGSCWQYSSGRKASTGCYAIPVHGHPSYKLQTPWALRTSLLSSKILNLIWVICTAEQSQGLLSKLEIPIILQEIREQLGSPKAEEEIKRSHKTSSLWESSGWRWLSNRIF